MTTADRRSRWAWATVRSRGLLGIAAAILATVSGINGTQDAVANGDSRTLQVMHEHTKESASIQFKRNGYYDQDALKQLNWLLRDWRLDEPTRMEPRLFDIVWEVYREVGAREPIRVVSAYRSPNTNAMLRRRSKGVAEHSQHMAGKAMDFYLPDVSMARVREIGVRLQHGGVGFYPNSYNPFVHLDAGSVRSWPRLSSDQLARLFPDGRTVHLPRDGRPLAGYEIAKAEILSRGGSVAGLAYADAGGGGGGERKSLWATLFGGSDDEDSDFYRSPASRTRAAPAARNRVAYAGVGVGGNSEDGGTRGLMPTIAPPSPEPVVAARSRRGGRTELAAAPELPTAVPAQRPEPETEAAPAGAAGLFAPTTDVRLASLDPSSIALVPTPPKRPEDLALLFANVPLPPTRPFETASNGPVGQAEFGGQMRTAPRPQGITALAAATDDRAALKALFDAAASPTTPSRRAEVPTSRTKAEPVTQALRIHEPGARVRMDFSSASLDSISVDRFEGPAVARLRTIR